jgi:hypothetical protein
VSFGRSKAIGLKWGKYILAIFRYNIEDNHLLAEQNVELLMSCFGDVKIPILMSNVRGQ